MVSLNSQRVFSVDAYGVRESSPEAEEFTLHGAKPDFPDVVPSGEVWVSRRHFSREGIFLIAHSLAALGARERGLSEDNADAAGLDAERAAREDLTGEEYRDGKPHRRVPDRLYDELYTVIPDPQGPIKVWLVDGMLARCWYKTDYAEGGHFVVYPWIIGREIWLERDADPREQPFICVHEYLELRMMRDGGLKYDDAHPIASKIEFGLRREKSGLPLTRGRRLHKSDLPRLADADVYEHVERTYLDG
jgi:hypothetical protein